MITYPGPDSMHQDKPSTHTPAIISLLPMFLENAHSVAMILHSMNVIKSAVQYINPVQTPVITLEQPLFAVAKQIQWNWPASHGENQFVIMLGGLHIEMAAFKVLGNWLDGSGWMSIIADAGVKSTRVADSFIKASHLTRTRRAHQITVFTSCNRGHIRNTKKLLTMALNRWILKIGRIRRLLSTLNFSTGVES